MCVMPDGMAARTMRMGPSPETAHSEAIAPPAGPPHVAVKMISQPRYLSGARDLVSAVARRFGFDDHACGQIALAVDEALCNVIRHGYDRRSDGPIWLSLWPEGDGADPEILPRGIRIMIEDEAQQVDPDTIRGRDLEDVRPGGLGVFIIRQVMTAVRYERRAEGGMRLLMVKIHENGTPGSS